MICFVFFPPMAAGGAICFFWLHDGPSLSQYIKSPQGTQIIHVEHTSRKKGEDQEVADKAHRNPLTAPHRNTPISCMELPNTVHMNPCIKYVSTPNNRKPTGSMAVQNVAGVYFRMYLVCIAVW